MLPNGILPIASKKSTRIVHIMKRETVIPAPRARAVVDRLRQNIERTIKGKTDAVDKVIITLLAGGHILIEDLPGLGKTTLAYCLARSLDCSFFTHTIYQRYAAVGHYWCVDL
jgi:MoxR-like ATPase